MNEEYSGDLLMRHESGRRIALSIVPFILTKTELSELYTVSRVLAGALEKVASAQAKAPQYELFWKPHLAFREINVVNQRYGKSLFLSRFDFILDDNGVFKLLEFNTACPAGACFFHSWRRISLLAHPNGAFAQELGRFALDDPHFIIRTLTRVAREFYGAPASMNVVLGTDNSTLSLELDLFATRLRALGHTASIQSLDRLSYADGTLRDSNGAPVDLVYCKCSPPKSILSGWSSSEFQLYANFTRAVCDDGVCVLNPMPAQTIAEDKAMLAYLHLGAFDDLLSEQERNVVRDHVPETYVLGAAPEFGPGSLAHDHRDYVLKPRCETRGALVEFGKSKTKPEWDTLVDRCTDGNFVLQRFVPCRSRPLVRSRGGVAETVDATNTLSVFVVAGEPVGVISRTSLTDVHNVSTGGMVQSVIVGDQPPL